MEGIDYTLGTLLYVFIFELVFEFPIDEDGDLEGEHKSDCIEFGENTN